MTPLDKDQLVTATGGGIPFQQTWIQPLPETYSATKIGWQSSSKGLFPKLAK